MTSSFYWTKYAADVAASRKELDAAKLSQTYGHSSSHRFKRYKSERFFIFFWRVVEVFREV